MGGEKGNFQGSIPFYVLHKGAPVRFCTSPRPLASVLPFALEMDLVDPPPNFLFSLPLDKGHGLWSTIIPDIIIILPIYIYIYILYNNCKCNLPDFSPFFFLPTNLFNHDVFFTFLRDKNNLRYN